MTRDAKSLSNDEIKKLFEQLFLHYKKDVISEQEMLGFFKKRGIESKTKKNLRFLMYKAERELGWITAGVGPGWTPTIFAKTHEDLEEFLEKQQGKAK